MKEASVQEQKTISPETMPIQSFQTSEVLEVLGSSPEGLSSEEVGKRLEKYGKNIIEEAKGEPLILKFIKNFISMMAILLWVGGGVAIIAEMPQLGIAIWLVNIINGLFSFWQEFQAGKATDALKKMLPSYARVIRNGKEDKILVEDMVPGDIILIEEGDRISADARLLESSDLQVNQSTLNGEANPARKVSESVLDDKLARFEIPNMIFAGTSVSSGSGKAVVISTAMNTEFGKIAKLTQSMKEEKSPLQEELDHLTKQISMMAVGIGILFFLIAVFFVGDPWAKSFIFALGMIVAFIPEGLLPTVTLSLAMAVRRMSKENALMKKLSAVETLGSTTVICSDKTGTLTQNEMTVSNLWLPQGELEVTGTGYGPEGEVLYNGDQLSGVLLEEAQQLVRAAALCSNARILPPDEEHPGYTVLGDPTEACLGVVAEKVGLNMDDVQKTYMRLRELPFDSRRKRMTTVHQLPTPIGEAVRVGYVKGAPKEVMELSNNYYSDGKVLPMTEEMRNKIMEANDSYALNGLRVLGVGYRLIGRNTGLPTELSAYTPELVEDDLIFLGLVVMADPPRPEVAAAVEKCHKASIRIIMITGDYGLTAESIAKRIGIVKGEHPRVISGVELEDLSEEELIEALKDEVIFARMAPEQKYRIVCALQKTGNVVAVTGDGVNDAPALKKADIGVAMGITGTDVAKEAADMILTDDNFASIVKAVEEGRAVYSNIQKFLLYIFNSNMAEAVPSAAFLLSKGGIPLPLTVMQILFIDLGTDMVPALGLGTEEPEPGIMEIPPRDRSKPLLNKKLILKAFFWYGLFASVFAMAGYFFANWKNGWPGIPLAVDGLHYREATTMALAAIVFSQIGAVQNCRTETESIFKIGFFKNRLAMIGIVVEVLLVCVISYFPPAHGLFDTAPLGWEDWLFLICIPVIVIAIDEVRKFFKRKKLKKGGK